jgi:hypothetical protein
MNKPHPMASPYLDEIDARITEAKHWGNEQALRYATWQRSYIIRAHRARVRLEERKARAAAAKVKGGAS